MSMTQQDVLYILQAIRSCGSQILSAHDVEKVGGAITEKSGAANFVTVFDTRVQQTLISALQARFPAAAFFAEEKENSASLVQQGLCFIIDPIDGTTNFIHDMKCSAVSVGLYDGGRPVFGAVYDPYKDEMFHACVGGGAFLNDRPIHVSDRELGKALVSFGTTPYERAAYAESMYRHLRNVFALCADLRRSGSAALDVCYVACGRTDAYFEDMLSPWDYAAGAVILAEAGGRLTSFTGQTPRAGEKSSVLCTNNALHEQMLSLMN